MLCPGVLARSRVRDAMTPSMSCGRCHTRRQLHRGALSAVYMFPALPAPAVSGNGAQGKLEVVFVCVMQGY